jgi:hypothetical protein
MGVWDLPAEGVGRDRRDGTGAAIRVGWRRRTDPRDRAHTVVAPVRVAGIAALGQFSLKRDPFWPTVSFHVA